MFMTKGMRFGAGLLGLGYGVYRLRQGRRDWVTSMALTAGLTATLTGMKAKRHYRMAPRTGSLTGRMANMAPAMMDKVSAVINDLM
jgi:hypothetical protein